MTSTSEQRTSFHPQPPTSTDFVSGLEGVVAFTSDIAEPDKDGGALRYRGVDIEDLVGQRVT
uniref:citrate/2-methylcitrate synthase n=3 Tax=Rhodococcus erythropolis group TaxID=2840174 RepID=UPI00263BD6EA